MSRGLGHTQNEILSLLAAQPCLPLAKVHQAAAKSGIHKASVSRAIRTLENRGQIERFETEFDGRSVQAIGTKAYVELVSRHAS